MAPVPIVDLRALLTKGFDEYKDGRITLMAPTAEFMSEEWLSELQRLFSEVAAANPEVLGEEAFILQEEYYELPDGGDFVFHVTFHHGKADFKLGRAAEPSYVARGRYEGIWRMAATEVDPNDPDSIARYQRLVDQYATRTVNVDADRMLAFTQLAGGVHNQVAAMTIPPPSEAG